jgi:hypothetical protein
MHNAALALGLLCTAFLAHLVVWRIRLPRRHTRGLLMIFIGILPLGLVVVHFAPVLSDLSPIRPWDYLQIIMFHVAMSLAYIHFYSGLELRSPRMTLVTYVSANNERGVTADELQALLGTVLPLESRLNAMVDDGFLAFHDDECRLTPKGRFWATFFLIGQRIARLGQGG